MCNLIFLTKSCRNYRYSYILFMKYLIIFIILSVSVEEFIFESSANLEFYNLTIDNNFSVKNYYFETRLSNSTGNHGVVKYYGTILKQLSDVTIILYCKHYNLVNDKFCMLLEKINSDALSGIDITTYLNEVVKYKKFLDFKYNYAYNYIVEGNNFYKYKCSI